MPLGSTAKLNVGSQRDRNPIQPNELSHAAAADRVSLDGGLPVVVDDDELQCATSTRQLAARSDNAINGGDMWTYGNWRHPCQSVMSGSLSALTAASIPISTPGDDAQDVAMLWAVANWPAGV